MAFAKALPAERAKAARHPVFIRLRPLRLWLVETARKYLRNGDTRPVFTPPSHYFLPRISIKPVCLFLRGGYRQFASFQPPNGAHIKSRFGFRPKLIAVTCQALDIDRATSNRPEAAPPGIISEIAGMIHRAGKNALACRTAAGSDRCYGS